MRPLIVLTFAAALAAPAHAATVAGVNFPDRVDQAGRTLVLNGAGLRTKLVFKVYAAALYLPAQSSDPAAILRDGGPRRVQMVMMRDLGRDQIAEAVVDGFEKNAGKNMPALRQRLDRFVAAIPDLESGESLTITWDPASGTTLHASGGKSINIEGRDFSDALFSVWLGAHPVDETLKKAMLGRK